VHIATPRLLLREFTPEDLPAFRTYRADPRYGEFYGPREGSEQRSIELFALIRRWAREQPRRNYQLAIVRSGDLIGCGGVRTLGLPRGRAELGLELGPRWWGLGYATEAARALLCLAFVDLGAEEVRATTAPANARAGRLILRLGFERVATHRARAEWKLARGVHARDLQWEA
jgi:RimJ/RimL family protein N-acetyltransferase